MRMTWGWRCTAGPSVPRTPFLPNDFKSSANPAEFVNMKGRVLTFTALGMDALFTDDPDLGLAAALAEGRSVEPLKHYGEKSDRDEGR